MIAACHEIAYSFFALVVSYRLRQRFVNVVK